MSEMTQEIRAHLETVILPFWKRLLDEKTAAMRGLWAMT